MRKAFFACVLTILCIAAGLFLSGEKVAADNKRETLKAGCTYIFANSDNANYCYVTVKPSPDAPLMKYDYVSYDKNGLVDGFGSTNISFLISAGGSVRITVMDEADLDVEYASERVNITETEVVALYKFMPEEGSSIEIINKNDERTYNFTLARADTVKLTKYAYVYRDASGRVTDFVNEAESGSIWVDAGGSTLVTPEAGSIVSIYMPSEWAAALSFSQKNVPALYCATIPAGKALKITNTSKDTDYGLKNGARESELSSQFDYVYRDSFDLVTDYGTWEKAKGAITVKAGGSALIYTKNGLRLWMPNEWINNLSFIESSEPALYYYILPPSRTLVIENKDTSRAYAVSGNAAETDWAPSLNYIYKDASGFITDYGIELTNESFRVNAGGVTEVSVSNGYAFKLWMPNEWLDALSFSETDAQVINTVNINPGASIEIVNEDKDTSRRIAISGTEDGFDYVLVDEDGTTEFYNGAQFDMITAAAGGRALVTASKSKALKMWFPAEWKKTLNVDGIKGPALYEYRLFAGKTAVINNSDSRMAFELITNSVETGTKLDLVLYDVEGMLIRCEPAEPRGRITVEAGGTCVITAGTGSDVKLWLPGSYVADKKVTIGERTNPAVHYSKVKAGQSLTVINNNQDRSAGVWLYGDISYDYVERNSSGSITGYGLCADADRIVVEPECTFALTANKGADFTVYMPYEQSGGDVTLKNVFDGVYSRIVSAGETVEIVNSDKNYSYEIATDAGRELNTPSIDYLVTDSENQITVYGSGDINGAITVPNGGRVLLTAGRGRDVKLWFPQEYYGTKITVNKATEPALGFYTVKAGKAAEIVNISSNAYNIANNSGAGLSEPKYDYTYKTGGREETVAASHGVIAVQPNSSVSVRASNGYDLKLWMPYEWLKRLTIR